MNKLIISVVLAVVLSHVGSQRSPCPAMFRYGKDGDEDIGEIQISRGYDARIDVVASFRVPLDYPETSEFRLEPDDRNPFVNSGERLRYRVRFPPEPFLPELTVLAFNDDDVCYADDTEAGPYFKIVILRHFELSFKPPPPLPPPPRFSQNYVNDEGQRGSGATFNIDQLQINHFNFNHPQDLQSHRLPLDFFRPKTPPRPLPPIKLPPPPISGPISYTPFVTGSQPTTSGPSRVPDSSPPFGAGSQPGVGSSRVPSFSSNPPPGPGSLATFESLRVPSILDSRSKSECGVSPIKDLESLPPSGSYTRGDWPWLVGIYGRLDSSKPLRFLCVGSLVSEWHVVTAAHCVPPKGHVNLPKHVSVKIGAFDFGKEFELGSQVRTLSEVTPYEYFNTSTLSDDIAILTFEEPVVFDAFTKPVCLWNNPNKPDWVFGTDGIVAGWGESEDTQAGTGTPNYVKMPIVSTATCRDSNPAFWPLTSSSTLCAGSRNGIGPCLGDSGGGLYVIENGIWMLRGIVSLSLRTDDDNLCNLNEYIIFTDIQKFLTWIHNVLNRPNKNIGFSRPVGQGQSGASQFSSGGSSSGGSSSGSYNSGSGSGYGHGTSSGSSAAVAGYYVPGQSQNNIHMEIQVPNRPTRPTTRRPPSINLDPECGLPNQNNDDVVNSGSNQRGDFPWLVALFRRNKNGLRYACDGTLISDRDVITAAQCLQRNESSSTFMSFKDIIVKVGAFDLDDADDGNAQLRSIRSGIVHKNFNKSTLANDIAFLKLENPINFTPFVRPICVLSGARNLSEVVGTTAVVGGWGVSEREPAGTGTPTFARMTVVAQSSCRTNVTSPTKFCAAGGRNGVSPCVGSSGGGLYILERGRWQLKGVVSQADRRDNGTCILNGFKVFTNIAQFQPWLDDIIFKMPSFSEPGDPNLNTTTTVTPAA